MAERLETHQGGILPWLNAREHISATSCQESGPLHKLARKDEEHGGQPAPFALVDQYEPSRKLPGMRLSGRATAAWAQDAKRVRAPGAVCQGPNAEGSAPGAAHRSSRTSGTRSLGAAPIRSPRAPEPACQSARRAESPGHKKAPLRRAAPSPQTTDANQIRPES